ncbi:MAG: signal peptidase I, partial [Sulfolobales archaeon]
MKYRLLTIIGRIIGNLIVVLLLMTILLNVFGLIVLGTVEGPSMEPLFQTGDLVVIIKSDEINVGDIIIFKKKAGDGFIIHRVIEIRNISN